MDIKELNKKIDALGKANATVEATIQELGIVCLAHLDKHNDTMPLNRLYNVLRRTQYQAFGEWAMAYGKVVKNMDKVTKATQAFSFAKAKVTDLGAAAAKPWFMFADDKPTATAKAFDFQVAMMQLLKKAAANGVDHDTLVKAAALADIAAEKVPATVVTTVPDAAPAMM